MITRNRVTGLALFRQTQVAEDLVFSSALSAVEIDPPGVTRCDGRVLADFIAAGGVGCVVEFVDWANAFPSAVGDGSWRAGPGAASR